MLTNEQWANRIDGKRSLIKDKLKEALELARKLGRNSGNVISVILNEDGEISIIEHSEEINPKEIDDRKAIYIYAFYPEYLEEIKDFDIDEFLEMKISGFNWQAR
jgi:hypothetical protein